MRRHLILLLAYFAQYAKVRVSYRADFLIGLATSVAATAFSFGFVLVLFSRVPQLAGWRFEQVLFLYGFSLVPFGLFNVLSLNLYDFGNNYIVEGKFDRVLLRPVGSLFQVLFETFRIESFHEVALGLLVVAWASRRLGLHWTAREILLLAGFGLCGSVIYVSVFLGLSTVSFWFEDRIGLHPPAWNLLAFGRYPLSIYSSFIQFLLSWIIPFGFATFYPSVRLLASATRGGTWAGTAFTRYAPLVPAVAAATLGVALLVWNQGVRRYSSTGT
ncbi:MAG: ABC-2 family transporter protein [Acidobacteria bacterium]|nr:ABC-2 family transporter protein [Acidobacteriota bacterium]